MREVIATDQGPKAIGPYSQGIRTNGFVFLSGQIPSTPSPSDSSKATSRSRPIACCKTSRELLESSGTSLAEVVETTVFLKNMSEFAAMNEVYGRYFTSNPPARSTVEVARLPKDVLIEIEVIALA